MDKWAAMRAEYVRDGLSHRALAKKYGVSLSSVGKRSSREGWVEERERMRNKAAAKTVDRAAEAEARRTDKLWRAADRMLDKVTSVIDDPKICATTRDIRDLTGAMKDLREILSIKNAREIREQEARINKLIHDAEDRNRNEAQEIRVTMVGADVREYGK